VKDKKAYCFNCSKETEYRLETDTKYTTYIKGKEVVIPYEVKNPYCTECGNKMFIRSVEAENFDSMAAAARYYANGGGA
jgi:DNA-directed RNA polymerase subunit RPC12/RpoP